MRLSKRVSSSSVGDGGRVSIGYTIVNSNGGFRS